MRIAMISREYPPDTGWGGIATHVYHLAQGLKTIGHDVEVFALSSKNTEQSCVEGGIMVHRVGVHNHAHQDHLVRECSNEALDEIHKCIPHVRYVLNASVALWNKFEQVHIRQPFEVVDTPELFADSLFVALKRNVPLVIRLYTPHAKFIADQLNNINPSLDHEAVAMLERLALYQCDLITSPSHDLAGWVAKDLNYPLERIKIAGDPMDCQHFCPEGEAAIQAPDKIKVLFIGRLEQRKGVHYLIDAIPQVVRNNPRVHLYLLGADTMTGPRGTSVLAELKSKLQQSGCANHVTFIPPVKHLEVASYIRSADICVVPSLYDNAPFTCLESMACGKAVIGTDAGGTAELLKHGGVGLVVPARDADALADAILNFANNEEKRLEFGRKARECAVKEYSREIIAEENVVLYKEARELYAANAGHPSFMRDQATFIADADGVANSLDYALHQLRLRWSIRYRITTAMHRTQVHIADWFRLAQQRPKLALAKLALGLFSPAIKVFRKLRTAE